MLPMLLAITGAPWETDFVGRLGGAGSRANPPDLVVVRRCVDVADLLATASTGVARAALVWPKLHRLDADVIADLMSTGVAVVAIAGPGEMPSADALRPLGVTAVVTPDVAMDRLASVLAEASARIAADSEEEPSMRLGAEPMRQGPDAVGVDHSSGRASAADSAERSHWGGPGEEAPEGSLIAVWGPTGAPGRTAVAVALAGELAAWGTPTLLVDADTYGGTVAEVLGIIDEPPGLAAAARLAQAGSLDLAGLAAVARQVAPRLRVLTGLARADRWPELRPRALERVWEVGRQLAAVTIVDCGFCLEQDEEISFDVSAPRRNGATLATLSVADIACAVVAADPIGVVRFVRAVDAVRAAAPAASMRVVVNGVRKGPIGRAPERQLTEVIERHTGLRPAAFVPYDRGAFDTALAAGRLLADAAPGSPARIALRSLARSFVGAPDESARRGRRRREPITSR